MFFSKVALIATALVAGAAASPAPVVTLPVAPAPVPPQLAIPTPEAAIEERDLVRRGREGIHLVNCGNSYSVAVYCSDDTNCNKNPANNDAARFSSIVHWEGPTIGALFPSGVTFTFTIQGDAQSKADFTRVGTGSNSFHTNWVVYKDNKHVMWTENGLQCKSIYYALY